MQLGLFDSQWPSGDPHFARLTRRSLPGRGSRASAWVDFTPGWCGRHELWFRTIRDAANWEHHRRQMYDHVLDVPRLVASLPGDEALGYGADEVRIEERRASSEQARAVRRQLQDMSFLLSQRYERELSSIALGYYRDGQDSVAFHGDKLGPLRGDTVVAIVSVGCRRRFLLRPRRTDASSGERDQTRPRSLAFDVGEGDLLVMGGDCQLSWEHAVPKCREAGPRIAIMFRERVRAATRTSPPGLLPPGG